MEAAAAEPTLHEHLRELRRRLLWTVGVFIVAASAGYFVRSQLVIWLAAPLHQRLYYTSPSGSFEFVMKLCGLVGLLAALPVLVYNLARYVEPAIAKRLSPLLIGVAMGASLLLATAGVAFGYYVSLPAALRFFAAVGPHQLTPLITVSEYFGFVLAYLATFAVAFQLPLVLLLVDHVHPLGPGGFGRWRKYAYVGAFAVALIIPSAPDPLSQVILAAPLILLFELSAALIAFRRWHQSRRQRTPNAALSELPGEISGFVRGAPVRAPRQRHLRLSDLRAAPRGTRTSGRAVLNLRPATQRH